MFQDKWVYLKEIKIQFLSTVSFKILEFNNTCSMICSCILHVPGQLKYDACMTEQVSGPQGTKKQVVISNGYDPLTNEMRGVLQETQNNVLR